MPAKSTITSTGGLEKALADIVRGAEASQADAPRQQITCPECGSASFQYDGEKGDAGHLICNSCGHDLGTHGEVMRRIAREMALRVLKG